MLRVEVDLIALGNPDHPRSGTLREFYIYNDGTSRDKRFGNYGVCLGKDLYGGPRERIGEIRGLSREGPHRNRLMLAAEGLKVLHQYLQAHPEDGDQSE